MLKHTLPKWLISHALITCLTFFNYCYLVCEIYTLYGKPIPPSIPISFWNLKVSVGKGEMRMRFIPYFILLLNLIFPICITLDTRNKYSYWYFKHGHQWTREKEEEAWKIAIASKKISRVGFLLRKLKTTTNKKNLTFLILRSVWNNLLFLSTF